MKKSLIVAATFAAITLGAANVANAGVAGTSLAGISAHADIGTGGIGITAGIGFARGVITASTAGGGNLAP
jgi:hypothetical protein